MKASKRQTSWLIVQIVLFLLTDVGLVLYGYQYYLNPSMSTCYLENPDAGMKFLHDYLKIYAAAHDGIMPGGGEGEAGSIYPVWVQDLLSAYEHVGADTWYVRSFIKYSYDHTESLVSYDMLLPGVNINSIPPDKWGETPLLMDKSDWAGSDRRVMYLE